MSEGHKPFRETTQRRALARQGFVCGSCGERIVDVGEKGRQHHSFKEGARGHHIIPHAKMHGPTTEANCVVLCESCHLSAHGNNTQDVSFYSDLRKQELPMDEMIQKVAAMYPHYKAAKPEK
jgi:5-methylcytosine-specific restriction endonuclease McrA